MSRLRILSSLPVLGALCLPAAAAADVVPQGLPFSQTWSNIGLITADDNWSGVPGIEGFRGDGLTGSTGTDPQTILAADDPGVLDVNANQTDPNTFSTGGAAEFLLANPVVALAGSGTADAPYLRFRVNTTGASGVTVSYLLRDIESGPDDAVQQVALQYRIGASGNFTNVPAGYVADATVPNATTATPVCAALLSDADHEPEVQIRIMTTNAAGNDEWVGVDELVVSTAPCGNQPPFLSVSDVALAEGNVGTTIFQFSVNLSAPAPDDVTFDIATADGTAQDDVPAGDDEDYVARALAGQMIPEGQSTFQFDVTVNGDIDPEAAEAFFVNVTNLAGAVASDAQGQGTIQNDDTSVVPIHDVQGPGDESPMPGAVVTVEGIVTGVRGNGFFLQEEDADVDADPATSEGILVFTDDPPPAAAAVGARVQVTATVSEFSPGADPEQDPMTELVSPSAIVQLATAQPLPSPVPLTSTFPDDAGIHLQLERLEGMRVSVSALTVSGPTLGSTNEPNATSTSTGVFYGAIPPNARPFREPGVQLPDTLPAGSPAGVPRFDTNPERLRVDSDALVGAAAINAGAGATVSNLVGPLDYTFRTWSISPDPASAILAGGPAPTAVSPQAPGELTVASYNVERFFDTVDDPGTSDPILTATAFNNRLTKASRQIRNFLRFPDIIGVVEVEKLTALQAIADKVNADAVAASQPNPMYVGYLVEGNDVGGIDVGFLVKSSEVAGGVPRVSVTSVTQERDASTWIDPSDGLPHTLNDRPPLRLAAVVNAANGASFALQVIVVHQRSLNGVGSLATSGSTTEGARVRAKRRAQAEDLADLIQDRQVANPAERIVVVGDFNAFEFSDGFVDVMGTVLGTPAPANEVVLASADLVTPDLVRMEDASDYSFVFDGNAQNLDHALINAPLVTATSGRRIEHARINADFPDTDRNDPLNDRRLADHDPLVAYFAVPAFEPSLFEDDFESGGVCEWSTASPVPSC
jgi:uncharacterized protein